MKDEDYGTIKVTIEDILKKKNISKNKLIAKTEMQRTQLNKYCKQKMQRLDISILSKICYSLDCDLCDILKYIPPSETKN